MKVKTPPPARPSPNKGKTISKWDYFFAMLLINNHPDKAAILADEAMVKSGYRTNGQV